MVYVILLVFAFLGPTDQKSPSFK